MHDGREPLKPHAERGGELGSRIRGFDWSTTPLGPLSEWPQSLRTAVDIMLSSQHPMWIGWGREATFLYNDAYIPVLSLAKHPWALGKPAAEVWAEIWDVCGPLADKVFGNAEPTFVEDVQLFMSRGDRLEETYYSFSYSPIRDESDRVAGLFCPSAETSAKVLTARRLQTLSDLSTAALSQKNVGDAIASAAAILRRNTADVPFAILYVLDPSTGEATIASAVGIEPGEIRAPWITKEKLKDASTEVRVVSDHLARPPIGLAGQPVTSALLLPLGADQPVGFLVAGVNPTRLLDSDYKTFFELVAHQIAASIQSARIVEEEKRRADALADLDRAKTSFFSNVSHEFRTPLTLLIGPTEDALHSPERALRGEALESVYRNELRLMRLVNSLLDFSRIEAGRANAYFVETDVAALTRELASAFQSATERAEIRLEVDCEPTTEPVFVDRDMWEKIVLNLVSNAFKFTFTGAITVRLRSTRAGVELVVRDTGVGIPEHELPRVFERFHRVESTKGRTHEGSGIGLSLVQELVRMHGGAIRVQSELGRGTTFTLTLPFGAGHLPSAHLRAPALPIESKVSAYVSEAIRWLPDADPASARVPRSAGERSSETVLVADDNADMREYLTRLLSEHWHVETVADGVAALERVRRGGIALVLTDVMMPRLDGFGLLQAIRGDGALGGLPVVMLSARAGDEARVDGIQAGADDYLVKPFSARELVARIRARLEVANARHQLERERQRLTAILEHLPVGLSIAEPSGSVRVNGALHAMWRIPGGAEVRPESYSSYVAFHEDGTPYALADWPTRRVLATEKPVHIEALRFQRFDGSEAWMRVDAVPLRDNQGNLVEALAVTTDVTEQKAAEESLRLARAEAERANRAKDEFLAMLGHELRNPLAPMGTALELLRLKGHRERELSIIARQVTHLTRLVDDLLDVSRITRGKLELRWELFEIGETIVRAMEVAAPLFEQRKQHVDLNVPAEGLVVRGDRVRLAQVFANILTNASKYSEPATTVHVRAERADDRIVVRIVDAGIGLDAEMAARVFDTFYQEAQDLDRARGGLGLGLAIVKSLVEMHQGTVAAYSQGRGYGSEFVVELPLGTSPAHLAPRHESGPPAALVDRQEKRRILVVDDNEDAAEMLTAYLESLGCDVRTTYDAPSALSALDGFDPEICLLDIGLPEVDGYELARQLRRLDPPDAPRTLVAVTGYGRAADQEKALEAGFDTHLVKPLPLERVRHLVLGAASSQTPQTS